MKIIIDLGKIDVFTDEDVERLLKSEEMLYLVTLVQTIVGDNNESKRNRHSKRYS